MCCTPSRNNKRHLPRRATRLSVSLRWPARAKTGKTASALRTSDLRSSIHLWNNEPHNEGHPHCKKLIVDNEPIWAHYQNNEPCSLCQKYNERNNEGNNDAHCWAHCWRNTMRATMRLIVGERAPF